MDRHNEMEIDSGTPDAGASLPVRDDMDIDLDAQVGDGRAGADQPEDNPLGWGPMTKCVHGDRGDTHERQKTSYLTKRRRKRRKGKERMIFALAGPNAT